LIEPVNNVFENKPSVGAHKFTKSLSGGSFMLNPLDFVFILALGAAASCIVFLVVSSLRKGFAKYSRYGPYKPEDGHEGATRCEAQWYPPNPGH
jgi:hypothetical protein